MIEIAAGFTTGFEGDQQENVFPFAFVDVVGEIAVKRHAANAMLYSNVLLYCTILTSIGLISDTHGYLDPLVADHFASCDEIWHAGDFGNAALAAELAAIKPLKGVYGNIDGQDIRSHHPEQLVFCCEDVKVMMRHIGGYPPKYNPATLSEMKIVQPQLFISGHSHILKVMYDPKRQCLHMNPGAAGKHGWHKVRTLIRFRIDGKIIQDCEVIELGGR